jgi:hypothetical protein
MRNRRSKHPSGSKALPLLPNLQIRNPTFDTTLELLVPAIRRSMLARRASKAKGWSKDLSLLFKFTLFWAFVGAFPAKN